MKSPVYHYDYFWDPSGNVCTCVVTYDGREFMGTATCHPNDKDVRSHFTGENIAGNRAFIKVVQYIKSNDIDKPLNLLTNLYKNMETSHRFNPKSFEAKQLYREIKEYQKAQEVAKETIASIKAELKQYIDDKDKAAQLYRIRQKKAENEQKE